MFRYKHVCINIYSSSTDERFRHVSRRPRRGQLQLKRAGRRSRSRGFGALSNGSAVGGRLRAEIFCSRRHRHAEELQQQQQLMVVQNTFISRNPRLREGEAQHHWHIVHVEHALTSPCKRNSTTTPGCSRRPPTQGCERPPTTQGCSSPCRCNTTTTTTQGCAKRSPPQRHSCPGCC